MNINNIIRTPMKILNRSACNKQANERTAGRKLLNIAFILSELYFTIAVFKDSSAQSDMGTSFVTGKPASTIILRDYEAIGVNPANLGLDDNNRFSLGLGTVNINFQSRGMDFKSLISSGSSNNNQSSSDLSNQLFKLFNKDGMNLNTSLTIAGISLHLGRLGGISLSMRDRVIAHISDDNFNQAAIDSLFNGDKSPPISSILNSTNITIEYLRELNIAYGFKLFHLLPEIDIYGGVGYRYIMGIGYVNLKYDNNSAFALTSINGSNYNHNIINLLHVPLKSADMFNTDGRGSAIDVAANVVFLKKIKVCMSVNNIGSIKWNSMQQVNATNVRIDSLQKQVKTFGDLFNQDNLFKKVPGFTAQLPAECRLGAGIKLSRLLEIGADIAKPLNRTDDYNSQTIMSAGLQLNLFNTFKVNTGISGNQNIGWNVPLGITLSAHGFYDIYLATNDILTYLSKTRNPMVSFAICAIRINLPAKKNKTARFIN